MFLFFLPPAFTQCGPTATKHMSRAPGSAAAHWSHRGHGDVCPCGDLHAGSVGGGGGAGVTGKLTDILLWSFRQAIPCASPSLRFASGSSVCGASAARRAGAWLGGVSLIGGAAFGPVCRHALAPGTRATACAKPRTSKPGCPGMGSNVQHQVPVCPTMREMRTSARCHCSERYPSHSHNALSRSSNPSCCRYGGKLRGPSDGSRGAFRRISSSDQGGNDALGARSAICTCAVANTRALVVLSVYGSHCIPKVPAEDISPGAGTGERLAPPGYVYTHHSKGHQGYPARGSTHCTREDAWEPMQKAVSPKKLTQTYVHLGPWPAPGSAERPNGDFRRRIQQDMFAETKADCNTDCRESGPAERLWGQGRSGIGRGREREEAT